MSLFLFFFVAVVAVIAAMLVVVAASVPAGVADATVFVTRIFIIHVVVSINVVVIIPVSGVSIVVPILNVVIITLIVLFSLILHFPQCRWRRRRLSIWSDANRLHCCDRHCSCSSYFNDDIKFNRSNYDINNNNTYYSSNYYYNYHEQRLKLQQRN